MANKPPEEIDYLSDDAKALVEELKLASSAESYLQAAQAALDLARAKTLQEVVGWHLSRAKLLQHRPGFTSPTAKEEDRARASENEFAASYLQKLPDLEAQLSQPALLASDAETTAFQLLYERQLGETNAQFLARAQELAQRAIDANVSRALEKMPEIDEGMPLGWRLERLELYGDKLTKYRAFLWKVGGDQAEGLGPTPRKATQAAIAYVKLAENKEK